MECNMSFAANTKEPRKSEISQKFDPIYGDRNGHNIFKFNTSNQTSRNLLLKKTATILKAASMEFF